MEALNKLNAFLDSLDEKGFYTYLSIILGIILLVSSFLVYRYYSSTSALYESVNEMNEERAKVRTLLTKAQRVKSEQTAVNRILSEEKDFKIVGYFESLVKKLGLPKPSRAEPTSEARGNYTEQNLQVSLADITMKQLTELLQAIEENKRIYEKRLEIIKSKKRPGTIEANLTIATLSPQVAI